MKSIYKSKTFWLAVGQAVIGIIIVLQEVYPSVGALVLLKSGLDILLRVGTHQEVKI